MQEEIKIRWRVVLPIAAGALSAALMVISSHQYFVGRSWYAPTSATVLNFALNGPGFIHPPYLASLFPERVYALLSYQAERLFGIVLLWFLIGRAIDRKREQKNFSLAHPREALLLFAISLALSLILLIASWVPLVTDFHISWEILKAMPLQSTESIRVAQGIWAIGLSIYFVKRNIQAVKALQSRRARRNGKRHSIADS